MSNKKQLTMSKLDTICRLIAAVVAEVDEFAPDIPEPDRKTLKNWLVMNMVNAIWSGYCNNPTGVHLTFKKKIAETLKDETHAVLVSSAAQDSFDTMIKRVLQKHATFWHENQSKESV